MARQVYIATNAELITTNNSGDIPHPYATVYIGGGGNIKVTTDEGSVVTFVGVVAGTTLPVSVRRIWATGTSATNLIALW